MPAISGLTSASTLDGSEALPVVQSGATKKASLAELAREPRNAQTLTSYTMLTGDRGKLLTLANAGAIAVTLPQAGASFPDGWWCDVQAVGAGTATITPTTSTINGGAALVLTAGQSARVVSDGTNYRALLGSGAGLADGDKGDITVSGSGATWSVDSDAITYAKMQNVSATARVLGRKTAGAGDPEECTLSDVLDFVGSPAQGDILYRGAATWTRLAAGTSGHVLTTQGAGADPQWAAGGGGGAFNYGLALAIAQGLYMP